VLIEKELKFCLKFLLACLCVSLNAFAQHRTGITAVVEGHSIHVSQVLVFNNDSRDTLTSIVLNDWNNSYSGKDTPLAKRFSDEFVRSFYRAKDDQRGATILSSITDDNDKVMPWVRTIEHPDLIEVVTPPILPGQEIRLSLVYELKLPSNRFTGYGFDDKENIRLKDCFLTVARFEGHRFARYSNKDVDDSANGITNWQIRLMVPTGKKLVSDLEISPADVDVDGYESYDLMGKNRVKYDIFIESEMRFSSFKNEFSDVQNNLESKKVDDIKKAIIVDNVVRFVAENLGRPEFGKIAVSQADYAQNPFYGLNQLPSFINVFQDDFIYELKFLKTYTDKYLKQHLKLDPRTDNWIYDGIQVYLMMRYIDTYYPQATMTGSLSRFKLLRGYSLMREPFNGQYSYFYMLMARKNLDQPAGAPKDSLLKFNEQIAGKYRAGLSFKYLDSYLGNGIVAQSLNEFLALNETRQTSSDDFENILKKNAAKNIDWFFRTVIETRDLIDYKFDDVTATNDSVSFTLKNRTGVNVPMPIYGIKDGKVVFKHWLENIETDSTYTVKRNDAEKIVINLQNEVPEYNLRNNWRSLKKFHFTNRPIKFVFFKDLDDPKYNQILYVPTLTYNLYDGLTPGIRFYNKTILDKVFAYDINPMFSSKTQSLSGSTALVFNQYIRDSRLYHIKYYLTGSHFHYAPDATYNKITPSVQFRIRENDFRDNRKQFVTLREVIVDREPTNYVITGDTENYSVFNARYSNTKTEVTGHFNVSTDFQAAAHFGKAAVELGYRKLFKSNRQLDLRLYAGTFLYNETEGDYFSFALDRPTDYLFDNNYYGRSESSGLFSQQLILTEGGFKSKLAVPFANQWIATVNGGINIWNWIEVYGDGGFMKNHNADAKFLYDSGVRLNLVTDYFELYFPVYSSNGWELQNDYSERIRFIVTLDPKILVNLFTRKWF
jgi:hypothetical protein